MYTTYVCICIFEATDGICMFNGIIASHGQLGIYSINYYSRFGHFDEFRDSVDTEIIEFRSEVSLKSRSGCLAVRRLGTGGNLYKWTLVY
jgi:hypothetical protein